MLQKRNKKKRKTDLRSSSERPCYHQYNLHLIQYLLCLLLESGIGFRTASKSSLIENRIYSDYKKTPSHTTLQNWVYKVGYHELTRPKEKASDWIIILDHSIQLGSSKILVIYGIHSDNYDFSRALTYTDLTPLVIKIQSSWNSTQMKEELLSLQEKIGHIAYAVADHCGNLRKGLELAGIPQIHDISHRIALLLEKRYLKDDDFIKFNQGLSRMRSKLVQSSLAHLVPVSPRKKSIYQNLGKTARWASGILNALHGGKLSEAEIRAVEWMLPYEPLVDELENLNRTISRMEECVKNRGLSKNTIMEMNAMVNQSQKELSDKGMRIIHKIMEYCKETSGMLPEYKKLLCTSDIIESAFGKYKNLSSENPMACVTKMVLALAAITVEITTETVKNVLEEVKLKDIDKWEKDYIGTTVFKNRCAIYSAT